MVRSIVRLIVLAGMIIPIGGVGAADLTTVVGQASPDAAYQSMPPHPRLEEAITKGEVVLPRGPEATLEPTTGGAQSLGFDQPRGGPRQFTDPTKPESISLNALAVVVEFSDKAHVATASYFDTLIFAAPGAGRGSVRDYYREVSYGTVDIVTVNMPSSIGWKQPSQPYSYYVNNSYCLDGTYPNNCQKLAEEIVDAVNGVVNFDNYDNDNDGYTEPIMLIHAGPGAEFTGSTTDIWSHSWTLNSYRSYDGVTIADYVIMPEYWQSASAIGSDMTIGVFAHEMGHGFWGLPDLYDRDQSPDFISEGIGRWSLMASGSWNGPDSGGWGTDGSSPAWPDAWTRIQMGFAAPTLILNNVAGQSIPRVYGNAPPTQTVMKLRSGVLAAGEYFLVENRQQVAGSYDEYLPGSGLLIWHVDEAMNTYSKQNDYECSTVPHCQCDDNYHYLVALEQADGYRDLELANDRGDTGDPYPGNSGNRAWTMVTLPESSSWYGFAAQAERACANTCVGVTNISNSGTTMSADLQVTCTTPDHWVYLPLVLKNPMTGNALWDQPLSTANQNPYVDQEFSDLPTYSSYLADDFTNPVTWEIDTISIPGSGWNAFASLLNADWLTWEIHADCAGVPCGDPSGGGSPPIWTLTLAPDDGQVTISNGSGGLPSDTRLEPVTPVSLPAGHWWLVFYPTGSLGTLGQFGRQPADTANGYTGKFINPGGAFGYGTAWQNWGVLGPGQQDIAFRLEGSR